MEHTSIPGLKNTISRIGLGTWSIGGSLWGGTVETEAIETIHKALSLGVNFIDTAPGYGNGVSETIVGKAVKQYGKRDDVVIATKFGLNLENNGCFRDSRKDFIRKELENSLKRLQTDYIDLYQVHWPDPKTPLAETAETLKLILEEGKVRAVGVSNFTLEQITEFKKYVKLSSVQPPFNLFEREFEDTLLPYCRKEKFAVIGYSAICRGLLSGKMTKDREFKGDDLRKEMDPKFREPVFSDYLACVNALKEWVKNKYRKPLIALAIRWVLDKNVNVALWGARKPEQLENIDQIEGWELSEEDFDEIDEIIHKYVKNPVGPQFMAPPIRD